MQQYLRTTVEQFHKANPLALRAQQGNAANRYGLPSRLFDQILGQTADLKEVRGAISSSKHQVTLSDQEEQKLQEARAIIEKSPYEPLTLGALAEMGFSSELLFAGSHLGLLVALPSEHWTTPEIVQGLLDILFQEEAFQDGFELSVFRDRLGTSRKFALVFLEYFDAQGLQRKGTFAHWQTSRKGLLAENMGIEPTEDNPCYPLTGLKPVGPPGTQILPRLFIVPYFLLIAIRNVQKFLLVRAPAHRRRLLLEAFHREERLSPGREKTGHHEQR